jgi:hypothetical protein
MVRATHGYVLVVGAILGALLFVAPGQGVPGRTACGVTPPNGKQPPGTTAGPNWYGNGKLFAPLWPYGVILVDPRFVNDDGSILTKLPWWGYRVPHQLLKIRGQRLDGSSRPLRASVQWGQPDGYRGSFWATGLTFPRAGCWQVTGRVGGVRLTFVTLVRRTPG